MKILFFLRSGGRTGSEVVVYNLICNADRQKMTMALICPVDGLLLGTFPPNVPTFIHASEEEIKLIHEQVKPDAWYVNTITQPSILYLARSLNVPCVLHTHELEQMLFNRTPEAAEQMVSYPKLVIASSEAAAEVMRVLGRKKGMEICYSSIDVAKARSQPGASAKIRTALGINDDDFVWAMSGTLDPNKNPVRFVEIAHALLRKNPRAHFIWIGGAETAYSRFTKAKALSLGLDKKVTWIPPQVDKYYDYLDIADGFVLTSTRDCFPLVMIEIAALGKPIVSFDSGGVREFFRPGMGVVLRESWNILDIVAAMIQVMDKEVNFDRRISKKRAAEFDVSVQVKHWQSLLESHLKAYLFERSEASKPPKDELNPLSLDVRNDNVAISNLPEPVQLDVNREIMQMDKLPSEEILKISLKVGAVPREVHTFALFWLETEVMNATNEALSSVPPYPVRLAYHWIEQITRQMVVFDGSRSALSPALGPNTTVRYPMKVVAPNQPGEYILQATLVQEGVCWFEDIRSGIIQEFAVSVIAGHGHVTVSSSGEASKSSNSAVIEQPLRAGVTIGIPIYRGKLFLEESLASVRNQTYSDIEVILSVDGPDPECEEICRKFLTDSRFRLVIQPDRLGWTAHTNWLMSQVQTEFWHLQEQDDVIEPTFLETLVRYAAEHPEVAAAYTDLRTFGTVDTHMEMSSVIGSPVIRQLKLMYEHFSGVAPLGLIRTEALRMSGGLHANEVENFAADTALMAGLARWGELHRLPFELYRKRVHAESTCATWSEWPMERQFTAWQVHCLDMLRQALLIDATPQDRRLLWLAVIERLVSPRTAGYFLNIAELTVAERADVLDSFLTRARTSWIDLPGSLASWDEIESWTKGFYGVR